MDDMNKYTVVVLDDGETYAELSGCMLVRGTDDEIEKAFDLGWQFETKDGEILQLRVNEITELYLE